MEKGKQNYKRLGLLDDGRCCRLLPKPLPKRKLSKEDMVESHRGFCFSSWHSESMDVDRVQEDVRSESCKARHCDYPCALPKASVIMVFHNEHLPTLLRSVHSVLNLSPADLLEEGSGSKNSEFRIIPVWAKSTAEGAAMLHRCAVSNACCPKLSEEDFNGLSAFGNAQMYVNPFLYDPSQAPLHFSMGGEDDGGDFPPGALALMYDPPIDDDLDSPDDWTGDPPLQRPQKCRDLGLQLQGLRPSAPLRPVPSDSPLHPATGSSMRKMPETASLPSEGRPKPPLHGSTVGSATPSGLGAHGMPSKAFGPASRTEGDGSLKPLGGAEGPTVIIPTRTSDDSAPRTFSRSIREAQSCTSEVGAASIAAILECVEQAEANAA
eukprot:s248_g9.t1